MRPPIVAFIFCILLIVLAPLPGAQNKPPLSQTVKRFDVLIVGGRVLDGTGNPWFYADIGIAGNKIVAVGRLEGASANRIVDARGKTVCPGFIDLHSHADGGETQGLRDNNPRRRAAPNLVSQGITTVVVNPDGSSPWPIRAQRAEMEKKKIGPNAVLFIGHNTVRRQVLENDYRRPSTPPEIQRMRALVRQGMQEGAFGLSAGLEYVPGIWSTTDEMIALVEEIVPFGGVYTEHERSSGAAPMWWKPSQHEPGPPNMLDSLREVIEIGERTGATVIATHIKARGANYWGTSHAAIQMIERARRRGVEIWGDQYPYNTSGSDGRVVLIPDWAIGEDRWGVAQKKDEKAPLDYLNKLRRTLEDATAAAKARRDVNHEIELRGGAENIVVFEYPDASFIGKSLAQLAIARHTTPLEMAFALQMEGFANRPGGARLRSFSFSELDVEAFAARPWVATASDAGITLPEDGPAVHARYYGTFPRKIRRYALERGVISVENAVRSATSLPAQILGLQDRGTIREGYYADVVILDLDRLGDRANFTDPHQYAEGIEYVLINGQFVMENSKLNWSLPGIVITPPTGRRTRPRLQ